MNTFQASWRLAMNQPKSYLINSLMWTGVHTLPLVPGLLIRQLFNQLTEDAVIDWSFWTLIALVVGVGIGRLAMLMSSLLVYIPFRTRIEGTLQHNMLDAILRKPGAAALPGSAGEAVSRFRGDVEHMTDFAGDRLIDLPGLALMPIIGLSVLFWINSQIALAIILPLIVIVTLVNFARRRLEAYREANRKAAGRVTGFIGEMYGAVQAIKVGNAANTVGKHLEGLNEKRRQAALKDTLLSELMHTAFRSTIEISTGIVLVMAGQSISNGSFTIGDFALFIAYLWPVTDGLTFLGNMLAVQKQTDVSLNRMNALVGDPIGETLVTPTDIQLDGHFPAIPETSKQDGHHLDLLTANNLTYRYPSTSKGIDDISLYMRRGSFTVITGRIGSGKTTLLRVLLGLLPLDKGAVYWNDKLVENRDTFFVPPRSAYTGQVPRLFSDTLEQNILMGQPEQMVNLQQSLHAAVMEKDVVDLEHGLQTMVGPRGVKLSGGQIQRSSAARMLAREPELYVFDDLSSALDVETERILWTRLFDRERIDGHQPTCLVVSHRRAALQRADHILVLKDGQVEDEGTLESLLGRCEEMQMLWYGEAVNS